MNTTEESKTITGAMRCVPGVMRVSIKCGGLTSAGSPVAVSPRMSPKPPMANYHQAQTPLYHQQEYGLAIPPPIISKEVSQLPSESSQPHRISVISELRLSL